MKEERLENVNFNEFNKQYNNNLFNNNIKFDNSNNKEFVKINEIFRKANNIDINNFLLQIKE